MGHGVIGVAVAVAVVVVVLVLLVADDVSRALGAEEERLVLRPLGALLLLLLVHLLALLLCEEELVFARADSNFHLGLCRVRRL